jgi:hypothetical protein
MNRLLFSLLLFVATASALNACSPASTLGILGKLPDPAMLRVMQFCSTDMQYLNKAGNRIVRNHLPTILRAHHFFADTSDYYITKYALAVIACGKAPQWVSAALIDAARAGNIAEVNRLLTAPYIDVNARTNFNPGWTALHWAVCWGHTAVVRALLADPRTDVNARDTSGWTALHAATSCNHAAVVGLLLADLRTDVNARNNDGKTALDLAGAEGHHEIATTIEACLAAHRKATTHHQSCCTIS